ncbi:4-oxalocrotonate tautomerase family protein [Paenibacillus sp. JMULE4]|nr:4-oxalocrotonate tautomerase family protein [Paenibacillus sp. JMULE4]
MVACRSGRHRFDRRLHYHHSYSRERTIDMPYVNIKITKENVTTEKKAELIQGVTRLLADVLNKNPQTTVVVIDEVDTDNWGIGGESVTVRRKQGK